MAQSPSQLRPDKHVPLAQGAWLDDPDEPDRMSGAEIARMVEGIAKAFPDLDHLDAVRSLYVHRDLQNVAAFTAWARAQGFDEVVDDPHVTVLYSKEPIDWSEIGRDPNVLVVPAGGKRSLEQLGDEGAVVLHFESDALAQRHDEMVAAGASHDYDSYLPHVTINLSGVIPDGAVPYDGELIFGPEIFETIVENKAFDPSEPRDETGKWTDGGGGDGNGDGAIAVDANKPVDPGNSKQITSQEKKSIDKYQSKNGFKKINKPLREGAAPSEDAKNLSSVIAKHSLTKAATVYRGVGNTLSKQLSDAWEHKKPGEAVTFMDKGFVSTSTRRGTAAVFSNQMIKLTIPQGHHVLPIVGKMPGEAEILLASGSRFKVVSVGPGVTQGSKLFEVELMS